MNSNLCFSIFLFNILSIAKKFFQFYSHELWIIFGDKRMKRFVLFKDGPYLILVIIFVYLTLVLKIIPNLMKNRPPLKLKFLIITYNIILVAIYLFYFIHEFFILKGGIELFLDFSIPSDDEDNSILRFEANLYHFFYLTEIFDLMDTIFFALRKKNNQITFLHLYHHTLVAILVWLFFWYRFNAKPCKIFVFCNCFVGLIFNFLKSVIFSLKYDIIHSFIT